MQFVIAGGGEVGLAISKILLRRGYNVAIIEKNPDVVKNLSEQLSAHIILGDITFFSTLQQIDWPQTKAFLAMTQDDAVNLLACQLTKTLGAQRTICRIHLALQKEAQNFNYSSHFSLDNTINTQHSCAFSIAKFLRPTHRVTLEQYAQGFIELRSLMVEAKSPLIGKTLQELALNHDIRIGLIQRNQTYFIPSRDTLIQENDQLTLAGTNLSILNFSKHLNPLKTFTHVTLFSGSEVSQTLILLLKNARFKIKIIESSLETCQQLSDQYPNVSVIHGDATLLPVLQEEQIQTSDYFIACSNDDEKNIIACLQAKKAGAKHTILWVNKEEYEGVCDILASKIDVDHVISTQSCLWKDLESMLFPQSITSIDILGQDTLHPVEILEIEIPFGATIEGLPLHKIARPKECIFLILKHKFRIKVPSAQDILLGGDRIVAAIALEHREQLIQLLTHKDLPA